ncbi:MAG TPA: PEP-CTERM sorting domain-containing protein [Lacipirellulaceae bacterium]|jgi:hypothetical protein|nr:PEP-CTERM sorting domain-containing protein [Lacipirellulaceae bacterium]
MACRNVRIGFIAAIVAALSTAGVAAEADPLTLQVDPSSGLTLLKNETEQTIDLTSYRLTSATGALNVAGWNPISNGNELPAQFPPDNGIDDGIDWEVAVNPTSSELVEWYVTGTSPFQAGQQLNLGRAVNPAGMPQIAFTYTLADETLATGIVRYESIPLPPLAGDYNNNGVVDAADYVVWRKNDINGQQGYDDWRANFGRTATPGGASALWDAIPEPATVVLLVVAALFVRRKRTL